MDTFDSEECVQLVVVETMQDATTIRNLIVE